MRCCLQRLAIVAGLVLAGPLVDVASACPMCKEAMETESALPRAYMYSIIFMLSVPATVLAGFGIGFYHLSKSANKSAEPDIAPEGEDASGPPADC